MFTESFLSYCYKCQGAKCINELKGVPSFLPKILFRGPLLFFKSHIILLFRSNYLWANWFRNSGTTSCPINSHLYTRRKLISVVMIYIVLQKSQKAWYNFYVKIDLYSIKQKMCLLRIQQQFLSLFTNADTRKIKQKSESACFLLVLSSSGYSLWKEFHAYTRLQFAYLRGAETQQQRALKRQHTTTRYGWLVRRLQILRCLSRVGRSVASGDPLAGRGKGVVGARERNTFAGRAIHSSRTEKQQTKLRRRHRRAHCLALLVCNKFCVVAQHLIPIRSGNWLWWTRWLFPVQFF